MSEGIETGVVDTNTSVDVESGNVEELDNISLESLLALTKDDVEEFDDEVNHVGMKPLADWMKNVPSDVRKHLANIRRDYTVKTQEISKIRASLQDKEAEIMRKNEHIMNGPLAQKLGSIDTTEEYDLFDKDGMKKEIQRQAALMLREMIEPAQKELESQQRTLQLEAFKKANPELSDPAYRGPILEMLSSRPELKLEDAFYIVKAKVDSAKLADERAAIDASKRLRKDVALKSSVGSRTAVSATPKFKNAIEAYNWHKAQGK
jgi:hypothetical protein